MTVTVTETVTASPVKMRRLGRYSLHAAVGVETPNYVAYVCTLWRQGEAVTRVMQHGRGQGASHQPTPAMTAAIEKAAGDTHDAVMAAPMVQRELRALGLLPPAKRCGCRCTCHTTRTEARHG